MISLGFTLISGFFVLLLIFYGKLGRGLFTFLCFCGKTW